MSNFLNKIPVSPITSFGNPSVPNGSTIGTNFSILQTGGYMEVYSLSGLTYTIPQAATGIIEFSGNSIPIQFTKGSGSAFSPDVLTLNSDNISSGRRKLGMLVYVYETNKIYQFRIDNYDTLWNNATGATGPGGSTVVISNFGTTVKNNSAAGIALINAWTASTISGVGGYNDTNASWRVLSTGGSSSGGTSFTGGTVPGATNFTGGLTANTFSAGTYYNLPITITGGTYSSGTTFLNNSTGGTINLTGYTYIPHLEYDNSNSTLWNNGFGNVSTNISYGQNALVSNTSGTYNTAIGGESLSANTSGDYNTGIGGGSLTNNTIGVQNFGIGSFALYYNTSGSYNTAIGVAALQDNTTAQRNVAIGGFSLYRNTGNRNIAIGFYSGVATKGSDNILLGANANNITDGLVSGSNNTIIGTLLSGVINGSNNTIFGKPTGLSSTTTNNIVIADGSGNIRFRDDNINTILSRLAGVGDRMVIAGSNGELSTRTITDTTFTGGTVSGATEFTNGLTANTISATTITVNNISGTTRLVGLQTFQGTTDSDAAPLGPELTTTGTSDSSWTGTSFASGYTHIPGSTTTLVSPLTAITGTYYYILATISGRTAGDITIDFGGYSNGSLTGATIYYAPLATTTGALTITPSSDFNGTITVSVKTIGTSLPSTKFTNSTGGTSIEIRADKNGNTFIGNNSGRRNFGFNNQGIYNTFVGQSAGRNNTSGRFNTFIGMETGYNNDIGFSNTFIGNGAGYSNTYGNSNTFIGDRAGANTTTANSNTALGTGALYANTTGIQNTAIGNSSLNALLNSNTNTAVGYFTGLNLTAGTDNILLGSGAARYISGGVTKATNIGNSIIIGSNTYPLGDSQTNQIVIGYQSIGLGSNTTVLGNSSTLKTAIYGNLLLGTTSDNGARLQVDGNTFISSGLTANTISATTYFNLPTDIRVTGGTYNTGSSSITFTNNTGGTFNVTGITSSGGGSFTGGTVSGATNFTGGLTANTITPTSIIYNDLDYLLLSSFRSTYNY